MEPKLNFFTTFKNTIEFTKALLKRDDLNKIITLRTVYKTDKITIQPPKDRNGEYVGGVRREETISKEDRDEGNYIPTEKSKRIIEEGTTFDLNKEKDLKDWKWIQYSRYIAVDEDTARSIDNVYFFIEMPEAKAYTAIEKVLEKNKAMNLVKDLSVAKYVDVCSLLGIVGAINLSPTQLLSILYTMADKLDGAAKIINVLEDPDYQVQLIFNTAKRKGIIKYINSIYIYGEIELGFTESQILSFLKDKVRNKAIVNSIIAESNGLSISLQEVEEQVEEAIQKPKTVRKPTVKKPTK